ncbi:MAG: 2-C-methyl-D-erythritol 2,4-cyclodiphosphate synthase [Clostridia bacterium]|nr:2-C-methyl-D-erythritol 2,4-cyclodiphosphate synthase [Clostridia bacterium]
MRVGVIIAAAGSSSRMGFDKLLMPLCGKSVIRRSVEAFLPFADKMTVVCSKGNIHLLKQELDGCSCSFCLGGKERYQSVQRALGSLEGVDIVLVHDGARPLIKGKIIKKCIEQTARLGSAVVGVKAKDTVKYCDGNEVVRTPDRSRIWQVQTPQGFNYKNLVLAYKDVSDGVTDDAQVYENAGNAVYMLEGDYSNIKLTTADDIVAARAFLGEAKMRIGSGFDVHAFADNRRLILCGVEIPSDRGLLGHSDADVAVHALMDAMLGAAGMRDIGYYFPDTDPEYKGADSVTLLKRVNKMINDAGYKLGNADITVIAQAPKLSPYIDRMRKCIADALDTCENNICIKATTTERLGFTGRKEGIAAQAVVLLEV